MKDYYEKTSIDEHVRGILTEIRDDVDFRRNAREFDAEIKDDIEFRRRAREFNAEQPTRLDRTLAAIYLWGAHLRVRNAIEVMMGRKILDEEAELQTYIDKVIVEAWKKPDRLTEIIESFYDLGKK